MGCCSKKGPQDKPKKCSSCSWCKKPKRCWYPCLYCIIPLFLTGLGLLVFEILMILHYFLRVKHTEIWITIMLSLSISTHFCFIALCQFVCILIIYEATGTCSFFFFIIWYIITLGLAISTLILTFLCHKFCPYGSEVIDVEALSLNIHVVYTQVLRWISIVDIIIILLLLHLYMYYRCFFAREKLERADKRCAQKLKETLASREPQQGRAQEPYQSDRSRSRSRPLVKLVYVEL